MITVLYTDVSPLSDNALYNKALSTLPEKRVIKAEKLKVKKAKMLSVGAFLMLGECLKKNGLDFDDIVFSETDNGKPFIKNKNLFFSLSHSCTLAVCALSDKPIGLDAEEIADFNPKVIKRRFLKSEQEEVLSFENAPQRADTFFRIWTIKEAYAKLTGEGMSSFKDFTVSLFPRPHIIENPQYIIEEFETDGYKISLCSAGKDDIGFEKVEINKIIR